MKKLLLSLCTVCLSVGIANAQLIKNDFMTGLNVGDALEKGEYQTTSDPIMADQWNLTGKANSVDKLDYRAAASPLVTAPLTYDGYAESGKGNSFELLKMLSNESRLTGYSLANANIYSEGAYYLAFLVNFSNASSTAGSDFIMFDGNHTANNQRGRVFIKKGTDGFVFGLAESASAPTVVTTTEYTTGTTYLLVYKYDFTEGKVKVFINPITTDIEPATADLEYVIAGGLATTAGIRAITVKQKSAHAAQLGSFRFASTWKDALLNEPPSSIENNSVDKGELVSSKYYSINGLEVKEASLESGVYIQQNTYENGQKETVKVIR